MLGDAFIIWIHILAATVFIGPQVFLFLAAMPALRTIEDAQARQRATRAMTQRFGIIGGAALVVLIVTGFMNLYMADNVDFVRSEGDTPRYANTFAIKMTLLTIVILLTALHGAVLGRRVRMMQERGASEGEMASTHRWSMVASSLLLLCSIGIVLCASIMSSDWAKG